MRHHPYFDPIIARYIRERLAEECKMERGRCSEIARITGISRSHLSNILDGSRTFGEDAATALCKYWGLRLSDLTQIAHETYDSKAHVEAQAKTHPQLDATLEFCRNIYPDAFLKEFEAAARQQPEQPKLRWFVQLHAQFRAWLGRLPAFTARKYEHLLDMPLTSEETLERPLPGRPRKSANQ
jgi:hypothetical protein